MLARGGDTYALTKLSCPPCDGGLRSRRTGVVRAARIAPHPDPPGGRPSRSPVVGRDLGSAAAAADDWDMKGPQLLASMGLAAYLALSRSAEASCECVLVVEGADFRTRETEQKMASFRLGEFADQSNGETVDPRAVIGDIKGNIYILERSGNALRVVDPQGRIRTLAGTGAKGFSGDGGDAKLATFNGPKHLCFDRDGNVIIADTENHAIRKYIGQDGTIVRVAGSGKKGTAGLNGSPLEVELNQPHGVYVHRDGTLYISDSSNDRILRVE